MVTRGFVACPSPGFRENAVMDSESHTLKFWEKNPCPSLEHNLHTCSFRLEYTSLPASPPELILSMNYGRKGYFVLEERMVNSRTWVSCGPGTPKNKEHHWEPQRGIASLGSSPCRFWAMLWTRPLLAPSITGFSFCVKLETTGKTCQTDREGCEVEGRVFCHHGRPRGKQVMGGWVFPKALEFHTWPVRSSPRQVIRGVKLEFSSEAFSPSADLFLFRPPEKRVVSVSLRLGKTFQHHVVWRGDKSCFGTRAMEPALHRGADISI